MKRILSVVALLVLAACNGERLVEPPPYRDAVRVEGRFYLLHDDRVLTAQDQAGLGPDYALVARRLACSGVWVDRRGALRDECGMRDGDATDLQPGTALRALHPDPAGQRLVAVREGRLLVFHAYFPPD